MITVYRKRSNGLVHVSRMDEDKWPKTAKNTINQRNDEIRRDVGKESL